MRLRLDQRDIEGPKDLRGIGITNREVQLKVFLSQKQTLIQCKVCILFYLEVVTMMK